MSIWFYIAIVLLIICIVLILKIYIIKKDIKDIEEMVKQILKEDTNNLITISSGDKDIIHLVNNLNIELKKLRNQKLQFIKGNSEVRKVITNISHDIRTPLTVIKGYIELLNKEKNENIKNEYLNIVNKKVKELSNLTEQLFIFTKTIDNSIKMNKEKICINECLEEALANYYTLFKEKNIEPKINLDDKMVYCFADKSSIARIFDNILSNAYKYSKGDVTIGLNENGTIYFSNKADLNAGMNVIRILKGYDSVESADLVKGVGLSIVCDLVKLNDGKISAKFEKNNVLTIEIRFKKSKVL